MSHTSVSSAATAQVPHRFVWDTELATAMERFAVRMPKYEKKELAKIAKENYRLIKAGCYHDSSGQKHSLRLPDVFVNLTHAVPPGGAGVRLGGTRHTETRLCIARMDTASAARAMADLGEPAACLNFANQNHVGGGYLSGARAQEEDLCRLMQPLYTQLQKLKYPFKDDQAHFTRTFLCRTSGSYEFFDGPPLAVDIITAAMPNLHGGFSFSQRMQAKSHKWTENVLLRMRAVLHAAREQGTETLVLGAFGCGAFGNPPDAVACLFRHCLASDEFRGCFRTVAFAILEPKSSDAGNFAAFADALSSLCR